MKELKIIRKDKPRVYDRIPDRLKLNAGTIPECEMKAVSRIENLQYVIADTMNDIITWFRDMITDQWMKCYAVVILIAFVAVTGFLFLYHLADAIITKPLEILAEKMLDFW